MSAIEKIRKLREVEEAIRELETVVIEAKDIDSKWFEVMCALIRHMNHVVDNRKRYWRLELEDEALEEQKKRIVRGRA